ncbi:MAG: geranylgeranyl reductase family protein [Dissulfurispiraceae bacterium]
MMLRTAVLVVGGGPAGTTAARFLAREGIDTILVERDFSYVKPCGGGIPSAAFHEFDLPGNIIRKTINKILIVSPGNREIEMSLNGGSIHITERGCLDSSLRQIARDHGASLIEGEFTGFEKHAGLFIACVKRKADGVQIKIQSDYLLAADGITFSTGRKSGQPRLNRLYTISTQLSAFDGDACEFWFGTAHASHFYSWIFPSDGHASIGTGSLTPRECPALLQNFLKRRFGRRLERIMQEKTIGRPRIFPIPAWRDKSFVSDKILFLGDAAGMVMPVTYEGIYYAMKSGQFAATAIIEKKPEIYHNLWEERFGKRFMVMNRLKNHFFRDDASIEKWISVHRSSVVQDLAMQLWLQKEPGANQLSAYFKAFASILAS